MNKKTKKLITNIVIYSILGAVVIGFLYNKSPKLSGPAYFFESKNMQNEKVTLDKYKGKVILLDFWGTWCPPCRKMIPKLVDLKKEYGDKVVIIGVHEPNNFPGNRNLRLFAKKFKINYPLWYGSRDVLRKYHIKSFPTMVIIDKDGEIRYTAIGTESKRKLKKVIDDLL